MCLKAQRAALCEGLAVLSCPMPGSSLRVLLSRCHRPLYVRFLPLDREHQSALFLNPEFCSKNQNFLCVPRALAMYVVSVRALKNHLEKT